MPIPFALDAEGPSARPFKLTNLENPQAHLIPVFLHSSFRTSSTWLWGNLRKFPHVLAYYEVFNEVLARISEKSIIEINYASWDSHHPAQAPYFLEYLPLLRRDGGVAGFDASMALERFIPEGGVDGDLSFEEQAYLTLLVDHAHRSRKVPLLSCTRSVGRMAAIKRFMPVRNILLYRNIFDQWSSYSGQHLRGNAFFFDTIKQTAASFHRDPFLNSLAKVFLTGDTSPKDENTFILFILMHIYLYARSVDSADVVVDTTALATDPALRHAVEAELAGLVFAPVDLSNAKAIFDCSIVLVRDRRQFVDIIEQFVKIIASTCSSERSAAFATKLKDDTLAQWDIHDTLTRNATSWYEHLTSDLQRTNDEHDRSDAAFEATLAAVGNERDGAVATLSDIKAAQHSTEAALATVTAERDTIAATLAATATAQTLAMERVTALETERDDIAAALAGTAAAQTVAAASAAALEAERDRMAALLAEKSIALTATEAEAIALRAERDRLAAALADVRAAKIAADEAVVDLGAARDRFDARLAETKAAKIAAEGAIAIANTERDQIAAILAETVEARDDAEAALATVAAERDRIAVALTEALASRVLAEETAIALGLERDGIAADRSAAIAAKTAAEAAVVRLESERDRVTASLGETAAAKTAAETFIIGLEAERDHLAATLAQTATAKAAADDTIAEREAERDRLGASLIETAVAKAAVDVRLNELEAERDHLAAMLAETSSAKVAAA